MYNRIVIIGSTGKLGSKLLNFTNKNSIPIFCATCFKNHSKLASQKKLYKIKNTINLSDYKDEIRLFKLLEKKIHIIYF